MDAKQAGIDRSRSVEDLHNLRLMALLDEQVRDKGPRRTAADLDGDRRILTAGLESGRPTGSGRPWKMPGAPDSGGKGFYGSCGRYG